MAASKPLRRAAARKRKLAEAIDILTGLQFGARQRNETAAYTLLAMLDLQADMPWAEAQALLRGITPIINFISIAYGVTYAPNTRETIRDDAVKFFVEEGLLLRNPDNPERPTNSGNTVYQIESSALALIRKFSTLERQPSSQRYLASRESLKIELFCTLFAPGGEVLYIGDAENKFVHLESERLALLGVSLPPAAKIPDVIVYYTSRNWLLLIEAVTTVGPIDGKRRKELKDLFAGCRAGLVFVTAFESRRSMQRFIPQISRESEVWIAETPEHMIHFDGEKFLGPYPDVLPDPN